MQCEYYSSRFKTANGDHFDTRRDSSMIKANFQKLELELITKLDTFVAEFGGGDEHYLYLFRSIMLDRCDKHTLIKEIGTKFVKTEHTDFKKEVLKQHKKIARSFWCKNVVFDHGDVQLHFYIRCKAFYTGFIYPII